MKLQVCLMLLVVLGCGKKENPQALQRVPTVEVVSEPIVEEPIATQAPNIQPSPLRPRFRQGLEAFIAEAMTFTNLPKTGPSVKTVKEQLEAVQKSFARIPDADTDVERVYYDVANDISTSGGVLVLATNNYNQALQLDTPELLNECKANVDSVVNGLKEKLKLLEKALDSPVDAQ